MAEHVACNNEVVSSILSGGSIPNLSKEMEITANANPPAVNRQECKDQEAAYHDTVSDRPLCSNWAKEAALDRLHDDGEIQSLEEHLRENPAAN